MIVEDDAENELVNWKTYTEEQAQRLVERLAEKYPGAQIDQ